MFSPARRALALSFFLLASVLGVVAPMATAPAGASVQLSNPTMPFKIAGGDGFMCMVVNGVVNCSGTNVLGQLGDGTTTSRNYLKAIKGDSKIEGAYSLAVGKSHACAVSGNGSSNPGSGKLYCWGDNQFGQLGDGTNTSSSLPVLVTTSISGAFMNASVRGIFLGDNHTCAITSILSVNRLFCWGLNNKGQLGDNTVIDRNRPTEVKGVFTTGGILTGATADFRATPWAAAGAEHTCAGSVANSSKIYCWGANGSGQLGNNSTTDSLLPVDTGLGGTSSGSANTAFVAAGSDFTCATDAGFLKCWGENGSGQMGNGGSTDVLVPTDVPTFGGFTNAVIYALAAGGDTVCVVKTANTAENLWCWGANNAGQVGDNTTTNRDRPTLVLDNSAQSFDNSYLGVSSPPASGLTVGRSVANGFACVTRWCWGKNSTGQLALGNTTDAALPSQVKTGVIAADEVSGVTATAVLKSTSVEVTFSGLPAAGLATMRITVAPVAHALAPYQGANIGDTYYSAKILSGQTLPTVSSGQATVTLTGLLPSVISLSEPTAGAETPFVRGVSYHITYSMTGTATSGYADGWTARNGKTARSELVATIDSSFVGDGGSSSTPTTVASGTPTTVATATTVVASTTSGNYATAVPGVTVTDAKVYVTAPQEVAGASAITVLTSAQNKVMDVVSKTPSICLPNDEDLVFLDDGKCIADVVNVKTRKVLRTLRTTVVEDDIADLKVGNEIAVLTPLYFFSGTTNFKDASLARLAKLKSRINAAGSVLIAGHSGNLSGNTPENVKLSQLRAAAAVKELKSRGAKGPFAIAAVGALDPASRGKSEADQDKNRRVVIVLIP
jgi:outer membrane protein OmpA-like peptidoglycan-associated protein